ncbi:hypothetical protein KJ786_01415 [Patescibacteria group bacterium]|nr:hypothetical protein [Patescibacteria group bacterium]
MSSSIEKNHLFGALIVGSLSHSLAEKCINWGDNFYVGDYEIIIFNLPSLDYGTFSKINTKNKYYFPNIRDQIVEAQEKTNLTIICITDKIIVDKYNILDNNDKINNYTWCPIIPIFEENGGKKIPKQERKLKIQYLNLVKEWERLFSKYYNNTGYNNGDSWEYKFEINKIPYLYNSLGRDIAFGLSWSISTSGSFKKGSNKPIIFLPKIGNIKDGIDLLLNDFVLNDEPEPDWIQEIKIVGQEGLEKKIEEEINKINQLEKTKNELIEAIKKLNKFKKLLYLQGKPLEKIVEESLLLLNVQIKELSVDNIEDRVFEYDNFTIPFEIRGKETKNLNESDLAQLIKRIADRKKSEKYKTRGVFVINHQRNSKPSERGDVCDYNIIKQANFFNICILSTIEIFNLVNRTLRGEKIDIKEKLFNTSGLFDFPNQTEDTK